MNKNVFSILLLIVIILLFSSCKRNHYEVNTKGINADIEIKRLEKDLFTLNPEEIVPSVPGLKEKYGNFLQLFSYVINTGEVDDPAFGEFLVRFCTDKLNNEVYETVNRVYPETTNIETDLEKAFRYYLHYFPGKTVPQVYTCTTGFNNSIITGDSIMAIGLDRYLGADCEYYPRLGIYDYISARMTPEYVVPDCMYGWVSSEWEFESAGYEKDNLLSRILHEGKLKYFEKCMMPEEKDEIIFGFTADQMNFCRNNENQMWNYLIENDLLFSTDQFLIRKFTGEAPFTSYFTNESPGRAAIWIGFRIIEQYMMKNKSSSLEMLMKDSDVQGILEEAKYHPEK
ncbi:MAG TPA: hypothetical protein VK213_02475 [Bacteroidales bacterium]|nr:hypothetical protein [Bacteroidales bacterium]